MQQLLGSIVFGSIGRSKVLQLEVVVDLILEAEGRGIPTQTFEGFLVLVPTNHTMQCTRYVPKLTLTMGNYLVT